MVASETGKHVFSNCFFSLLHSWFELESNYGHANSGNDSTRELSVDGCARAVRRQQAAGSSRAEKHMSSGFLDRQCSVRRIFALSGGARQYD